MGSHGGSRAGSSSDGGGTLALDKEYEYRLDDEFKAGIGKRLYNKIVNATSTRRLISDIKNSGYSEESHGISGRNGERLDISFWRERSGIVEQLIVTTRERYENGERLFWLDQATYIRHK